MQILDLTIFDLDGAIDPCLNRAINSDTRSVEPNRLARVAPRADAAQGAVHALRVARSSRALLLTSPGSVNWRSGGLSDPVDLAASSDPVWTLDCDRGRALITNDIEAPRLEHDFSVHDLGWDVVRTPWFESNGPLEAACSYAGVDADQLLSDVDTIGTNVRTEVIGARLELSAPEREELRELGRIVGEALGAGVDSWRPGISTDFEIAGAVSESLERHGARAVCLIVGGDDRLRSVRHPLALGDVVRDALMVVVVARRAGVHVAATRTCVTRGDDEIVSLMEDVALVNDAVLGASQVGGTWGETVEALERAYARIGRPGAWREHWQGGPIGFEQREFELAPTQGDSPFWSLPRRRHSAIAWNPSISGGAKLEDTYLLGDGLELVSATPGWPLVEGPDGTKRSALRVLK